MSGLRAQRAGYLGLTLSQVTQKNEKYTASRGRTLCVLTVLKCRRDRGGTQVQPAGDERRCLKKKKPNTAILDDITLLLQNHFFSLRPVIIMKKDFQLVARYLRA